MFLQSTSTTGITLVQVLYGEKVLAYFPVLVNDAEGIRLWRENAKLMTALSRLGIEG